MNTAKKVFVVLPYKKQKTRKKKMQTNSKKRDRNANFSREETEKLISLVELRKSIVESKKSDAVTWQAKENAWREIEKEFNVSGEVFRDAKHLKIKYEALKRDTRKKARTEIYRGGINSVPPLTPVEQKVKEIILPKPQIKIEIEENNSEGSESMDDTQQDYISKKISFQEGSEDMDETRQGSIRNECESPSSSSVDVDGSDHHQDTRAMNFLDVELHTVPKQSQNWVGWKPESSMKDQSTEEPQPKGHINKLAERNSNLTELRRRLLEEEIEQKQLQRQMLQEEMIHKRKMFQLETECTLMKMKILKAEFENKREMNN